MQSHDKIIELLGRGYSATVVASAVGCDDSYISQLTAQPEVREAIANLRLKHVAGSVALDDSVDELEKDALARLHKLLPFVTKPMEAVRIYQIANSATRRSTQVAGATAPQAQLVQISLPNIMAVQFKLSSDKQVVEINGKSMAALPSALLNKRMEERKSAVVPQLTDARTASGMLNTLERGIPKQSIANLL